MGEPMAEEVNKKMAAALAAVNAYMMEEEELALSMAQQAKEPQVQVNMWAISGRQEMMSMRNLIQMKAFLR